MQRACGIITVVQEGRFLLASEDGRSILFTLDHRSPVEPQDLQDLLGCHATEVSYTTAEDRKALTAHDIRIGSRR